MEPRLGAASRALLPYLAVSLLVGLTLAVAMTVANWENLGWCGALEMTGVMLWVSFVFNAFLMVPVALSWWILVMKWRPVFSGHWATFSLAALIGLDLTWVLWNRLAMVHQWASVRPFITHTGIVQSLVLVAVLGLLVAIPFLRLHGRPRSALTASVVILLSVVIVLIWNSWEERRERRYSLQRIASAAGISDVPDAVGVPKPANGKLVVLGLDGLSWNVMVPLLDSGMLPALSFLIRRGAFGYLDNGDQSLSPIVWTSIFTGRSPQNHGIDGYRKLNLPVSRRSALDLLLIPPSIDSFYGISHLLKRLPSAGLWWFSHAGSNDRKVPALWEIASIFGRTVVVVDPLANLPVKPLNGAAIDFRRTKDASIATCYPADLSKRWEIRPIPLATGATDASYNRLVDRVLSGLDITVELAGEYDPDLLVYYTNLPDTVSHMNWDFVARDRFFLTDLPIDLTDGGWESLVRSNLEDRTFRAYVQTDAIVGRFIETYPDATYVIVSDHGWTFSGYEHFGSPDGTFIVSGPGVRSGTGLSGISIVDVTPTVLAAMGVPLSRELEGTVVREAWHTAPDVVSVERYPQPENDGTGAVELSGEELERLRWLGYLE
jgi:predicted AlkP superfamily phosphohydrolase/phosphomutase